MSTTISSASSARTSAMLANGPPLSASRSLEAEDRANKPLYAQRSLLHRIACEQGAFCYQDPITNELIATSIFLLKHPAFVEDVAKERHCPHSLIVEWEQKQKVEEGSSGGKHAAKHHQQRPDSSAAGNSSDEDEDDSDDDSLSSSDSDAENTAFVTSSSSRVSAVAKQQQGTATTGNRTRGESRSGIIFTNSTTAPSFARGTKQDKIVSPFSRDHSEPVRVADLPDVEDILALPKYAQGGRMHKACCERKKDCYVDPTTGLTTFTRPFLEVAPCCGESCRHCPYGHSACRRDFGASSRHSSPLGGDVDDEGAFEELSTSDDDDDVSNDGSSTSDESSISS